MKKTSLISTTALLTFALLCIAPPMASASDLGFKSVSQATFAVKSNQRWWHKIRKGNFKKNEFKKKSTPKNSVDNPEPITGMLALAAAGIGGAAARKRKKNKQD